MNFNDLTKQLFATLTDEKLSTLNDLEKRKNTSAKSEDFQEALEMSKQIHGFRLFDNLEPEELNNYYLYFLYEFEMFKQIEANKFSLFLDIQIDIEFNQLQKAFETLNVNQFKTKNDLVKAFSIFESFQKTAVTSLLDFLEQKDSKIEKIKLRIFNCEKLLKKFDEKAIEFFRFSKNIQEFLGKQIVFKDYLVNVVYVQEVFELSIGLLNMFEKCNSEEDLKMAFNIRMKKLIDEMMRIIGRSHTGIHENVHDKILLLSLMTLGTTETELQCQFCGCPFSYIVGGNNDLKNVCCNLGKFID